MKRIFTTAIFTLVCLTSFAAAAQIVTGKVTKVRDADTIVVNGIPIRLNGVDAPENGTQAGNQATAAMKRYLSEVDAGHLFYGDNSKAHVGKQPVCTLDIIKSIA